MRNLVKVRFTVRKVTAKKNKKFPKLSNLMKGSAKRYDWGKRQKKCVQWRNIFYRKKAVITDLL